MNLAGDICDLNLTSLILCFSKIIGHCRISHPDWILILRTNKTHFLFSDLGSYFCIRKTPARNGAGLTRLVWQSRTEARVRDENMDHKSLPYNDMGLQWYINSHPITGIAIVQRIRIWPETVDLIAPSLISLKLILIVASIFSSATGPSVLRPIFSRSVRIASFKCLVWWMLSTRITETSLVYFMVNHHWLTSTWLVHPTWSLGNQAWWSNTHIPQ